MECTRVLFVAYVLISCFNRVYAVEEPTCFSRYDYDHKLMTSVVTLEIQHRELQTSFRHQTEEIKALRSELQELQEVYSSKIKDLTKTKDDLASVENKGATYIRFGRTVCPGNGTELVYEGYVGGSDFSHSGGSVNYLCLPKDPIFDRFYTGGNNGMKMHGAEYELNGHSSNNIFPGTDLYQRDVPCAVCRSKRSSVLVVPARNRCFDGWTMEYKGYLSSGHYTHSAASETVCLDGKPEVLPGGHDDHNGKLFYLVKAVCGSLRCPPYVESKELTCAVCSK